MGVSSPGRGSLNALTPEQEYVVIAINAGIVLGAGTIPQFIYKCFLFHSKKYPESQFNKYKTKIIPFFLNNATEI